jgi:hypothetical protein
MVLETQRQEVLAVLVAVAVVMLLVRQVVQQLLDKALLVALAKANITQVVVVVPELLVVQDETLVMLLVA